MIVPLFNLKSRSQLVIDRKRIFLFRPKTNIRHKGLNITKKVTKRHKKSQNKLFPRVAVASSS
jgi:hypothetical protein